MKKKEVNARYRKFACEYLIDFNATQAALRCGFSPKTAYSQGQRLLKNVDIQRLISEGMKKAELRSEIKQDDIIAELAKIAFSSATDYIRIKTEKVPVEITEADGSKKLIMKERQIARAIDTDSLMQHKKGAVAKIRETKYGLGIETYDKIKALELLGKHFGMFRDTDKENEDSSTGVIMLAPVDENDGSDSG